MSRRALAGIVAIACLVAACVEAAPALTSASTPTPTLAPTPTPTHTPASTPTAYRTYTPYPPYTPLPAPTPTVTPTTNTTPTPAPTPVPTNTPTPTPTLVSRPVPTPTPTLSPPSLTDPGPDKLLWYIAVEVPDSAVGVIRTGIQIVRIYLIDADIGDIPEEARRELEVIVVATGNGNAELGGSGVCCAFRNGGLFFDVLHPHWDRDPEQASSYPWSLTVDKWKSAAHEYTHAWQSTMKCLAPGQWFIEGVAEYVAYHALISAEYTNADEVRTFMRTAARNTGETDVSLRSLEQGSGIWPGHIGYLAVDWLVHQAPGGIKSLARMCNFTDVDLRNPVNPAFEQAFGISTADFYKVSDSLFR